ncbi:MAG: type VI secretion system baseplate subunit TssE [Desulfovibrio sp.]|jgi:type VI secretion system protein|nr:type VI secretion system baseplate subunit TssE [Desulfovibrio sp.]
MQDMTLLERIHALGKGEKVPGGHNPARLNRSLLRHLTSILNTRRGSVPIAPDYGIADVTDLGSSFTAESVADMGEDLERIVVRYEPRLSAVHIDYTPKPDMPLAAVFGLNATIQTKNGAVPLHFDTILDATGAVRLRSSGET